MKPFESFTGVVAPLDRSNIDTDAIIPKQFLKRVSRSGFGPNLFDQWRYLDQGEPEQDCSARPINPDFVLNQQRYANTEILLARDNFGCGSSREHALWALADFGIRVVVAPSFADIFHENCFKNGVLPVSLPAERVDTLFHEVTSTPGYRLSVDLTRQEMRKPTGAVLGFDIDPLHKRRLLDGLDEIGLTLAHAESIRAYEALLARDSPWLL